MGAKTPANDIFDRDNYGFLRPLKEVAFFYYTFL
jgi:hypothetical protein